MQDSHANGEAGTAQSDGQMHQGHGDAEMAEGCVNSADIGGGGVYIVREGGGCASGGGGVVQIPGDYPGPYRRRLAINSPEYK